MNKLLYLLLLLMLCCPQSLMAVKAVFLFLLILFSVYKVLTSRERVYRPKYIRWIILYLFSGVSVLIYGLLKGNPGPHFYYLVYFVWPIVFPLIFSLIKYDTLQKVIHVFEAAYVFIFIMGMLTFLKLNFGFPSFFNQEIFGYGETTTARPMFLVLSFSGGAVVQFFVLFSFLMPFYCLEKGGITLKRGLLLMAGMLYIVLSSRRIMMLGFVYIPMVTLILLHFSRIRLSKKYLLSIIKTYIIPFCVMIMGIGYIFIDSEDASTFFLSAVSSDGDFGQGGNDRLDQFYALLKGWQNNFFFGAGTGIDAGVTRSDLPGTYELSYMAILFERGTIGGLLYFSIMAYPIIRAIRLGKHSIDFHTKRLLISYCTCYISLLIANATNPYIGAFDFIWIVFLFIVILNLTDKKLIYERKNLCNNSSI